MDSELNNLLGLMAVVLAIGMVVGCAYLIAKLIDLVLDVQDKLALAWLRRMPGRLRRLNRH